MRDERRGNAHDNRDREPRWLHGHHSGQQSDRGNYTIDSRFNRSYGDADKNYLDPASFNSNADQRQMYPQGRFQPGGAQYSGEDYTERGRRGLGNAYGVTFIDDAYNSGRHYDARADYSKGTYDDPRHPGQQDYRYGLADERFGHEVRRGDNSGTWARGSRSDYESYRRYEHDNPMYDNDYTTGPAGRNYAHGKAHYGEDSHYSNLERWQGESRQRRDRYDSDRR